MNSNDENMGKPKRIIPKNKVIKKVEKKVVENDDFEEIEDTVLPGVEDDLLPRIDDLDEIEYFSDFNASDYFE